MKPTRASITNRDFSMRGTRLVVWITLGFFAAVAAGCSNSHTSDTAKQVADNKVDRPFAGVLVSFDLISDANLKSWRGDGLHVTLAVEDGSNAVRDQQKAAAQRLIGAGFETGYWIEVGRCPQLADAHPEWMSSLQGHDEWRRLFPSLNPMQPEQVVKNYPWVPILYAESFAAQRDRVLAILQELPPARRIWLNDLQGGPSACGCGHPLCRWTGDYGPIHTATPLGDDAAANFVRAIAQAYPAAEVIPIWTTECEAADEHESCGGVGCFDGICWKAYTRQLMHLEEVAPQIGVQCFFRLFERDLPRYGDRAGWVEFALRTFQEMPPRRNGRSISASRLIAVLEGWNMTAEAQQSQIEHARQAGAAGYLVALCPINQDWEPRNFTIPVVARDSGSISQPSDRPQ